MKHIIFALLFCSAVYSLNAQTIEGVVYDAKTRETVPGAAVYLDGTSILTITDANGAFSLVVGNKINTNLIISHLSYEPIVITNPFEHRGQAFYLHEKVNTLVEVRVVADRLSRAEKMKVFREQFLGESVAGKSCVIVNEEDIVLNYDEETHTLTGYSRNPIVIENRYLAYRITFDLRHFSFQFQRIANMLDEDRVSRVLFKGTSSFVDQSPYNVQYAKRREGIYLRSKQYFFKNLTANTLEAANIKISNRFRQIKQDQYFLITDVSSQKTVLILPNTDINRRHLGIQEGSIYGVIDILCHRRFSSEAIFLTHRFSVDEYGNPDTVDDIIFFGDIGGQRLGEMLPRDFTYTIP